LRRRNHEVRSCWAIQDSLTAQKDAAVNVDLISPSVVSRWNPNAIIFEHGLFIGNPRCPQAGMLHTSVTERRNHSSMDDFQLYDGVSNIAVDSAIPFDTWSNALLCFELEQEMNLD
jgi:hypothetical protein